MGITADSLSVLTPDSYYDTSCGYCGNTHGNISYHVDAVHLTAECYQKLIDRGWRRSGFQLYKPDQRASCCPPYTIRVDSHEYRPSKDQRKALNRFNKHMIGQKYMQEAAQLFPRTREQTNKRKQEFNLVERIHECESNNQKDPLVHEHSFVVTLEQNNFTEEKYGVFKSYERNVHLQSPTSITKEGFRRFLCCTPVGKVREYRNGNLEQIGSYHQCYWIDGKLVAVGVLDLLPRCVSSVYFMYHESVREFDMGKISAMREIALAKEIGYRWWYPGFYIHENKKMRYKARFTPLQILSPESYQWHLFTKIIKRQFNFNKYLSLTDDVNAAHNYLSDGSTLPSSENHHEKIPHELAQENLKDYIPLYARNIPGILTLEQLKTQIDLSGMLLRDFEVFEARDLKDWEKTSLERGFSTKTIIGEIASAVGPEICKEIILHFP